MVNYDEARIQYGRHVSQTLDEPVMVGDIWELTDVMCALGAAIVFGVILYSWTLLLLFVSWFLIIGPRFKKDKPRGYFLHWFYKNFNINLPGLFNPGKETQYSD